VKNSGCDIIVAGTAVFNSDDIKNQTNILKNLIK
jgi:pentose-5-phosphate-3-epimerase